MSILSISFGGSAGAMLSYLEHGRGGHNPDRESRVAAWDSSTGARSTDEFKKHCDVVREGKGKSGGREYGHFASSFDKTDPRVAEMTNETALAMGRDLAESIAPGHDFFAVVHRDKDHLHVHVVVNSVNYETGRKLHVSRSNLERAFVAKDVVDWKHGLARTERNPVRDRYARGVIQRLDRDPDGYLWTQDLKERIAVSAARATSFDDYVDRLAGEGVSVTENRDRTRLTYAMQDARGEDRRAGEKKLGTDYWRSTIERDIERRLSVPDRQLDAAAKAHDDDIREREELGREVTSRLRQRYAEYDRERSRSKAKPSEKPRQESRSQEAEPNQTSNPIAAPLEVQTRERKQTKDAMPLIPVPELEQLQNEAILRNDARAFGELEAIRQAQRTEPHLPARSAEDLARLEARAIVARADVDRDVLETPNGDHERANEMATVLERAVAVEKGHLKAHPWAVPEPKFTGRELHRLEENALVTRDVALLDRVDRSLWSDTNLPLETIASRAIGRAVVADLERHGVGVDREYLDPSSDPKVDRETRQLVLFAIDENARQAAAERAAIAAYADRASTMADRYLERLSAHGIAAPEPSFTTFERGQIEGWLAAERATGQTDSQRRPAFEAVLRTATDSRIDPYLGRIPNGDQTHGQRSLRALSEEDRGAAPSRGDRTAAGNDREAQGRVSDSRNGERPPAIGTGRDDSSLRPIIHAALHTGETHARGGEGGDSRIARIEERLSFLSDRVEVLAVLARGIARSEPERDRGPSRANASRAIGHDQPSRIPGPSMPSRQTVPQPDRGAGAPSRSPQPQQPERSLDRSSRGR